MENTTELHIVQNCRRKSVDRNERTYKQTNKTDRVNPPTK